MSDLQMLVLAGFVLVVAIVALVLVRLASGRRRDLATHAPDALDTPADGEPADQDPGDQERVAQDPQARLRGRLARTRSVLASQLAELFGSGASDEAFEGLEEALIGADVGVAAATEIVAEVRAAAKDTGAQDEPAIRALVAEHLLRVLERGDRSLARRDAGTTVWLVTGVNGTGKTTTIGKLAAIEAGAGRQVVLGAADTFRAAAAEQLGVWAERTGATLVAKDEGADPASVAFEAHELALAREADLLIVDTAGRLHNKSALMDELGKVRRVLAKQAGTVDETLLVLDATTGQNGIAQARAFLEAVDVSGIALTKLDGSSKGGIVVAVQRELGIPVKLVGLGEAVDDLAPFDPAVFVASLLDHD